jgi:Uma2 family endonuclease
MRAEMPKKLFTIDEYYKMAEVGILDPDERVELLEGEIVEMSPVGARHINCVNRANAIFSKKLGDRVIVSVQNSLSLSEYSELQPDIVLLKPRPDFYGNDRINWSDSLLVIEISDTTLQRDRDIKLPLYSKAGIEEFWIEDLKSETIFVYRDPGLKTYATSLSFRREDSIFIAAFPDVLFSVSDLIGG